MLAGQVQVAHQGVACTRLGADTAAPACADDADADLPHRAPPLAPAPNPPQDAGSHGLAAMGQPGGGRPCDVVVRGGRGKGREEDSGSRRSRWIIAWHSAMRSSRGRRFPHRKRCSESRIIVPHPLDAVKSQFRIRFSGSRFEEGGHEDRARRPRPRSPHGRTRGARGSVARAFPSRGSPWPRSRRAAGRRGSVAGLPPRSPHALPTLPAYALRGLTPRGNRRQPGRRRAHDALHGRRRPLEARTARFSFRRPVIFASIRRLGTVHGLERRPDVGWTYVLGRSQAPARQAAGRWTPPGRDSTPGRDFWNKDCPSS